jgi:hypothetical protein
MTGVTSDKFSASGQTARFTGFQNAKNGGWESLQTEIGKFLL